ncbi:MAG TPA: SDR family NAD(P)-dependent oxidoreductase [Roseiflexaceae bacterium]|jgi:NAD(P)-dependent dehydrogenase (short-subunit alcohol dehydrogenase family)
MELAHVIVIVGASRGIGRATALALAGAGRHLALAARDGAALEAVAAEVRARGAEATVVPCDVTAEPHVRRLIETAASVTGQIDLLVNSAGGAVITPFEALTLADWETTLRVGLTGAFLACKHAVGHMRAGALIVNVASVAARQAFPNWAAYSAAKHGLLGFSNAIREELRPRGVRVTVVLPAATDTALWDAIPGEWNRANMLHPNDVARAIAQLAAQPPYVTVEELVIGHVAGRL